MDTIQAMKEYFPRSLDANTFDGILPILPPSYIEDYLKKNKFFILITQKRITTMI